MSRYRRANISRNVWGGDTSETGGWFRSAATSPRIASQVCLICRREYKFRRKVGDALRGERATHTAIRHLPLSIVCCGLDHKINACRPSAIRFIGHVTRVSRLATMKKSILWHCLLSNAIFEFLKF